MYDWDDFIEMVEYIVETVSCMRCIIVLLLTFIDLNATKIH
jgi:hypothetical protein